MEIAIWYAPVNGTPPPERMSEIQHTLLNDRHQALGATMAPFGGYAMPLWYKTGPIREHRAVVTHAGLFDTSHMSELLIEGPDAFALLQEALTKDLQRCIGGRPLEPGRATYGFLLHENGHLLDDAIVMMESRDTFLLVVNAGMGAPVREHLLALGADRDVAVNDLTGKLCKLDLQGPASADILSKILQPTRKFAAPFPFFSFIGHYDHLQQGVRSTLGYSLMISRTGYTGEFGFEIFVRPDGFPSLWDQLLDAGEPRGLLPCGLGARDSLRTGAELPLSHQDLGDWPARHHPWEFALPWKTPGERFTKPFNGADALLAAADADHTIVFRGENGRKVENGARVLLDGSPIGDVLTCATDMAIDLVDGKVHRLGSPHAPPDFSPKGLACGFAKVDRPLDIGTPLVLQDKRRELPVQIVNRLRPERTARHRWPAS